MAIYVNKSLFIYRITGNEIKEYKSIFILFRVQFQILAVVVMGLSLWLRYEWDFKH